QRLQCTLPETELKDDDDMPADIDEFRNELARRINAFVDSRTGGADAVGAAAPPLCPVWWWLDCAGASTSGAAGTCEQRWSVDNLADARRAWCGQDATGRRVGEGAGVRNAPLCRSPFNAYRARRRDRARRAGGDDRGPFRLAARRSARRAAAVDSVASAPRMEQWRGGAGVFRGRPRAIARAAIRCRVERRACQVASRRCDLRHAAVRPAAWRPAEGTHHHHATAD